MTRRIASLSVCAVLLLSARIASPQSLCSDTVRVKILYRPAPTAPVLERSHAELEQLATSLAATSHEDLTGNTACVRAEILRRLGEMEADTAYRLALRLDEENAEFHWLYGDYLRAYRGPGQSLVYQAASEYYAGLASADTFARNRILRSLIALYERDGIPLTSRIDASAPLLFFSSQNTVGTATTDAGTIDDDRQLASLALLVESRTHHTLSQSDAVNLVRNVPRRATFDRLRARLGPLALDLSYEGHQDLGVQVTDFSDPASRNDVTVNLLGVGVEYVSSIANAFDLMLRGSVRVGTRVGLIEHAANASESVRSKAASAAVARFIGVDKLLIEGGVASDAIEQNVARPPARSVSEAHATVRYQLYRPVLKSRPYDRPIASRGSEFFAGIARTTEQFDTVDLHRQDLFAGVSLKGLPAGGSHSVDFTLQPTFLSSENTDSAPIPTPALANRQVDWFGTLLYRVVDRENVPNVQELSPLTFLNVVAVVRRGVARQGPIYFDRTAIGAEVAAKFSLRTLGGMTWLASGRYELQTFTQLSLREHVVVATVDLGF
jgi:hypothetical protein